MGNHHDPHGKAYRFEQGFALLTFSISLLAGNTFTTRSNLVFFFALLHSTLHCLKQHLALNQPTNISTVYGLKKMPMLTKVIGNLIASARYHLALVNHP